MIDTYSRPQKVRLKSSGQEGLAVYGAFYYNDPDAGAKVQVYWVRFGAEGSYTYVPVAESDMEAI